MCRSTHLQKFYADRMIDNKPASCFLFNLLFVCKSSRRLWSQTNTNKVLAYWPTSSM